MKFPSPVCSNTIVDCNNHVWIPRSFPDFLTELNYLISQCAGEDPLPLFRGHSESKLLLESTFARSCKRYILGLESFSKIPRHIQESIDYHRVVLNILLLKFGVIVRPVNEDDPHIDSWFELMRKFQQYPENDLHHFKGTFFLDWSKSAEVSLFFANSNRNGDGALWVCDTVATGKTLQVKSVGEVLDIMNARCNKTNPDPPGCPLIFHPPQQNHEERVMRQQAIYIAQMDLRFDFASIWNKQEIDNKIEQIFVKLVLPNGTQSECNCYLASKGITETWLFPDN